MRKLLIAAGFAAAAFIPSMASAQQSCEPRRDTTTAGIAAAAINALLGGAQARTDCAHVYGYYDANGMWHANTVNGANAQGYYDAQGRWVVGAPNGYYDQQGRWIAANAGANASANGYYDQQGRWVPASANGYYDANGRLVAGTASGYYSNGRWIAGPTVGSYDQYGRWIPGRTSGHRDAQGRWVADAQPGYYDANGRWRVGAVNGYYDTRGRWIGTAVTPAAYTTQSMWVGAPTEMRARITWMEQRIRTGMNDRTLNRAEGMRALKQLQAIRLQERGMNHRNGRLSARGEVIIQARLDKVATDLTWNQRDRRWGN